MSGAPTGPGEDLSRASILIVEDDEDFRTWEHRLLTAAGAQVTVARDGVEAVLALRQNLYDLIVSDLTMPRVGGFALFEIARRQHILTPFMFVSASRSADDEVRGLRDGVDFVRKPVHPQIFLARVGRALGAGTVRVEAHAAAVSRTIGDFTLEEVLGRGAMGIVYKARQRHLERTVALKLMHDRVSPEAEQSQRFVREMRTLAALDHPNLVRVHAAGFDPRSGAPYLVMEYLEGEDLEQVIERGDLSFRESIALVLDMVSGLRAAWAQGLVHRDIKPANVMLCSDGTTRVLDFGIVLRLEEEESRLTETGTILGSPDYMSPEQAANRPLDFRSDLYSVGMVLYRLLAGTTPFRGPTAATASLMHTFARPPLIHEHRPNVPAMFDRVLARLLAKRPGGRFPSAARVLALFARLRERLEAQGCLDERPEGPPVPTVDYEEELQRLRERARS